MHSANPILLSINKTGEYIEDIKNIDIERNSLYLSLLLFITYILSLTLYIKKISAIVLIVSLVLSIILFFILESKSYKYIRIKEIGYVLSSSIFFAYLGRFLKERLEVIYFKENTYVNENSVVFITIVSSIIISILIVSIYYYFFNTIRSFYFIYLVNILFFSLLSGVIFGILKNIYKLDFIINFFASLIISLITIYLSIFYHEEVRITIDEGIDKGNKYKLSIVPISLLSYGFFELLHLLFYKRK